VNEQRKILEAAYKVATVEGDWKKAHEILMQLSAPHPCTCAGEILQNNGGRCVCGRYAYLLRPATPEELMLSGC
jgi:hypothetical protein